jgi:hypothetical protein
LYRPDRSAGRSGGIGEVLKVGPAGVVKLEGAGEGVEDGVGG